MRFSQPSLARLRLFERRGDGAPGTHEVGQRTDALRAGQEAAADGRRLPDHALAGPRAVAFVEIDLHVGDERPPVLDQEPALRPARQSVDDVPSRRAWVVPGEEDGRSHAGAQVDDLEQVASLLGVRQEGREPAGELARLAHQHQGEIAEDREPLRVPPFARRRQIVIRVLAQLVGLLPVAAKKVAEGERRADRLFGAIGGIARSGEPVAQLDERALAGRLGVLPRPPSRSPRAARPRISRADRGSRARPREDAPAGSPPRARRLRRGPRPRSTASRCDRASGEEPPSALAAPRGGRRRGATRCRRRARRSRPTPRSVRRGRCARAPCEGCASRRRFAAHEELVRAGALQRLALFFWP